MITKKTSYILLSKEEIEEEKRIAFQADCTHNFWTTKCSICGKYLASDHHINVHTKRNFKKESRVAILVIGSGEESEKDVLSLYRIQKMKSIKQSFDELTVIVSTLNDLELYSSVAFADRVIISDLEQEMSHMSKYRSKDVVDTTLILCDKMYTQEQIESLKERCATFKINTQSI